MKELRIGIIGTGIIAHSHLDSYKQLKDVKVVAACDILSSKLEAFCDKYDIPDRYTNFREMLKRDDIDAVDVCVHNNLHLPLTLEVLRSGKHCYCEKPMAGAYADAVTMFETAKECGKQLHIQLATLYSPQAHAAKKFIADGLLGNIYHLRSYGYRRRGRPFVDGYAEKEFNSQYWAAGGALYDMGVYHISLLLYLCGLPKIKRISGKVYQELDMDADRRKESGFDVEELGLGFVKLEGKNGGDLTLDILESWAIHAPQFQPSLIAGSKAGLSIKPTAPISETPLQLLSEISGYPATTSFDLGAEVYRTHQKNPKLAAFDDSVHHWAAALQGECELINTAEIALNTMLISEGIYLSSQLGREVSADEVREMSVSKAIKKQETPVGVFEYSF